MGGQGRPGQGRRHAWGMIGFTNDFCDAEVWRSCYRPLEEYAGQEWVKPYLEMLIHIVFEINGVENGHAWPN